MISEESAGEPASLYIFHFLYPGFRLAGFFPESHSKSCEKMNHSTYLPAGNALSTVGSANFLHGGGKRCRHRHSFRDFNFEVHGDDSMTFENFSHSKNRTIIGPFFFWTITGPVPGHQETHFPNNRMHHVVRNQLMEQTRTSQSCRDTRHSGKAESGVHDAEAYEIGANPAQSKVL